MEVLHILEEKVAQLIESKKKDLDSIAQLQNELMRANIRCDELAVEKKRLEKLLLQHDEMCKESGKERESAKVMVDELIRNIDALMKEDSQ